MSSTRLTAALGALALAACADEAGAPLAGVSVAGGPTAEAPTAGAPAAEAPATGAPAAAPQDDAAEAETPRFVDDAVCGMCHADQLAAWQGSHHDLAMQPATEETVLGDFDDAVFEAHGRETRFRREGDEFLVRTAGADGEVRDFPVRWVFGVEPLQQVLVELERGHVQCLTVAWDVERERWYSLYPDEDVPPGDALHWTGAYQRWNSMCAECHSTGLEKGYDPAADAYDTTWAEIDVGCQACHGPGGDHVAWATEGDPDAETPAERGLAVALRRGDPAPQIDACARCHSRRTQLLEDPPPGAPFTAVFAPERLHAGLYHADGQILDEVYVWGSFVQSKMHAKGVSCSDCHDPHRLELWVDGDAVCLQCHSPNAPLERFETLTQKRYDVPEHHHHPEGSDGARCVSCHAPARTYMGIDERIDHSFRVPRPDLTVAVGTPNACTGCHAEEGAAWAAERIAEWTAPAPWPPADAPPHWAEAFAAARAGDPAAEPALVALVRDPERPAIVRATALELLAPSGAEGYGALADATTDPEPLVRASAARGLARLPVQARMGPLLPLLADPALAVRVEAARALADLPSALRAALPDGAPAALVEQMLEQALDAAQRAALARGLEEFRAAQAVNADLPGAQLSLGALLAAQGRGLEAERAYRRALELDPAFLPARFNLATLLNQRGRNADGIRVLQEGFDHAPPSTADAGELAYSLGLALAEDERWAEAADALTRAARDLPGRARVRYNQGLALQRAERLDEAAEALSVACHLDPADTDALHALVLVELEREAFESALVRARELVAALPQERFPVELVERARAGLAGARQDR